jgi:putative ABC transport system permease protein
MMMGELIRQAFRNLKMNKLRSTLSMLGITWGIVSVVVLVSFGNGIRLMFLRELDKIGGNIVYVFPGHTTKPFGGYKAGRRVRFEIKNVEAIRLRCPNVGLVIPAARAYLLVKRGTEARRTDIRGVVPEAKFLRNINIEEGRFVNQDDVKENRRFCVLGGRIKERLFKKNQAVGKAIKIKGERYRVIGVAKKKEALRGIYSNDDDQIYIPITTHMKVLTGSRYLWSIQFQPKSLAVADEAIDEVRRTLASIHNFSPADASMMGLSSTSGAIWFFNFAYFVKIFELIGIGMTILFGLVGVITLSIGGVGVMNIMRVAVIERTREIGIRKSVGARKRDILLQFLFEALIITFIGGFIGFTLGVIIILAYNQLPLPQMAPRVEPSLGVFLWSIGVMVAVGLLSGVIPARKAASIDPIESLRYGMGRR